MLYHSSADLEDLIKVFADTGYNIVWRQMILISTRYRYKANFVAIILF